MKKKKKKIEKWGHSCSDIRPEVKRSPSPKIQNQPGVQLCKPIPHPPSPAISLHSLLGFSSSPELEQTLWGKGFSTSLYQNTILLDAQEKGALWSHKFGKCAFHKAQQHIKSSQSPTETFNLAELPSLSPRFPKLRGHRISFST